MRDSRQRLNRNQLLILVLLCVAILAISLRLVAKIPEMISPISPPNSPIKAQSIENDDLKSLAGTIDNYQDFFIWNPKAANVSYPFISGTLAINWEDFDTGLTPVAIPYTTTTHLVIELELRGTETFTQEIDYSDLNDLLASSDRTGNFYNPIWAWIDVPAGQYDEWIRAYWMVGNTDEVIYIHLVEGGQVITPSSGFKLYRNGLTIPELMYLPVVMKGTR